MRILLVNKFLHAKGGAERAMLTLGEQLAKRGHEVFYFGMQHPENVVHGDHVGLVRHRDYHAESPRRFLDAAAMIYSLEARRRFEAMLQRARPDIVHFHNIYHQLTPSILDAAARSGPACIMTLHDYKLVCPRYDMLRQGRPCDACLEGGPTNCLRHRCAGGSYLQSGLLTLEAVVHGLRRSYDAISRFIVPSRFLRRAIVRGGWDSQRMQLIRNFAPPPQVGSSVAVTQPAVVYAGRLSAEKGVATLLHAAMGLTAGRLVLCGTGPQEPELRRLAADCQIPVHFRGHLSQTELQAELQQARCVAVPSEWFENAPFAVLEAMAAGKATLASDIGGIPEIVRDGETGRLLPIGDVAAWRQALGWVFDSPRELQEMGERSRRLAEREFSLDGHVDQLESLYAEVVA